MDPFSRLIINTAWFLVGVALSFVCVVGSARAAFAPVPQYATNARDFDPGGRVWFSGNAAAAADVCVKYTYYTGCYAFSTDCTAGDMQPDGKRYCAGYYQNGVGPYTRGIYYTTACPGNASGTSSCTCNSGYEEWGSPIQCLAVCTGGSVRNGSGQCVQPCVAGQTSGAGYYDVGTSSSGSVAAATCSNGCMFRFVGSCPAGTGFVSGVRHYYCYGGYVGMGIGSVGGCTSTPSSVGSSVPSSTPLSCGEGQCFGQVNGVDTCVLCGSVSSKTYSGSTTTVTNPDGTKTSTTTGTVSSSTPGAGVVVTSSTSTGTTGSTGAPSGASTSTAGDTKTQDPTSFCKDNPASPLCVQGNASGGADCSAAPSCSGDAIQCAVLAQSWQTRCQVYSLAPGDAVSTAGGAAIQAAANQPEGHPALTGTTASLSSAIDQTRFLGGGGLTDKTYTAGSYSITVPWSKWNTALELLGALGVAVSLIIAARIVGGA